MYSSITSRQRIKAAIASEPTDKLPTFDFLWQQVPDLWKTQGLGKKSAKDYFRWDIDVVYIDNSPRFEMQILGQDDTYITFRDRYGYTIKKLKDQSGTVHFLDYPAKSNDDWQDINKRLIIESDDSARIDSIGYFAHFDSYPSWHEAVDVCNKIYASDRYVLCNGYGPWEASWRYRGFEQLLMDTALEKDLAKEISTRHIDLTINIISKCLELGMKFDGFWIVEDLGSNNGLLISPDSWRELYKPDIMRLGEFLKNNDLDFWIHSCGNVTDLCDDLIECGIQVLQPLQVSAGMDVFELKKRYGKNLAYMGNLAVQDMAGPRDKLEPILKGLSEFAATQGGYILSSDHSVPPDVSFEQYKWITKTTQNYFNACFKLQ